MNEQKLARLAKPMLFATAFIWGSSFVVMKNTLEVMPVFYLLATRFLVGAAVLALVFYKQWKNLTKQVIWKSAVIGGCLFLAYAIQTEGLQHTTPSKNAFIAAASCVIVPFLYWILSKRKPDRFNVIAALLCVAGVGFVSLNEHFSINIGDLLTLISAFFYAMHIVNVSRLGQGENIYLITVLQFAFCGLFSTVGGILFESFPVAVFTDKRMIFPLFYLCILATAVALLLQNIGQHYSDPASASVILSLESVFGVICSVILYGDEVTARLLFGFFLIFMAVLCSETKFSFLKKKDKTQETS